MPLCCTLLPQPSRPLISLRLCILTSGRIFHRHPGLVASSPARAASPLPAGSPGSTGKPLFLFFSNNFGVLISAVPVYFNFVLFCVFRDLGLRLTALLGAPHRCDHPCAQRRARALLGTRLALTIAVQHCCSRLQYSGHIAPTQPTPGTLTMPCTTLYFAPTTSSPTFSPSDSPAVPDPTSSPISQARPPTSRTRPSGSFSTTSSSTSRPTSAGTARMATLLRSRWSRSSDRGWRQR